MIETDYEHLMRLRTMATRPELWRIKDEATVNCLRWALEQIDKRQGTTSACCEQRYRDSQERDVLLVREALEQIERQAKKRPATLAEIEAGLIASE